MESIFQKKRYLALVALATILILVGYRTPKISSANEPILYNERYSQYINGLGSNAPSPTEIEAKVTLLKYLDGFRNEEIRETFYNVTTDVYEIIQRDEKDKKRGSHKPFSTLSTLEKAQYYATELLPKSGFTFAYTEYFPYKDVLQHDEYIEKRQDKWRRIKEKFSSIEVETLQLDDDEFLRLIEISFDRKVNNNREMSQEVRKDLTHYKLFSHIFLNDENTYDANGEFLNYCSAASSKLFHFFTGAYPKFHKFDKDDTFVEYYPYKSDDQLKKKCFIKSLKDNLKGRGIVITTTDGFVPQLAGLIALLRSQGVEYPMQIFYDKDFSLESMKLLQTIATSDKLLLPPNDVGQELPKLLPKMDLSFIDVTGTLKEDYSHHYSSFGMKLQAYLFSTFEETIMLDTDSVPFKPLSYFFESDAYKSTGAYFFKDRLMKAFILPEAINLVKPFLNYHDEHEYLNIPMTDTTVLNNKFFTSGTRHFMESGIVTINKKEKFNGMLITYISQMIDFLRHFSYGDKELIWLGQAIAGNSFEMNKHFAVSAGELTPHNISPVNEVCSAHPSHISEDMELLWTNSGIFVCKNWHEYKKDISDPRYASFTEEQLKEYYLSPVKFTHAVIPPDPFYKFHGVDDSVESGWRGSPLCGSYNWCAIEKVGNGLGGDNIPSGGLVSFMPEQTKLWSYYGLIWANHFNLASPNKEGRIEYEDVLNGL